jgi:hypothetical protein
MATPPAKGKHPGGRPPALEPTDDILRVVFGLGKIQSTVAEAAAVLDVGEATFLRFLERHPIAAEMFRRGKARGTQSLRRAQMRAALRGNPTMLIWLGKNCLGQTDKIEANVNQTLNLNETKTLRFELSDEQLLAIAAADDIALDEAGSGDGNAEAPAGQNVTRRLQ